MKIRSLYVPDVHSCHLHDRLSDAARKMQEEKVGALAAVDDHGALVAIISERDLARALADRVDADTVDVAAYATNAVALASVEEDSSRVGRRMLDAGIRHLPVIDDGRLVGMVSMRDLLALHSWA